MFRILRQQSNRIQAFADIRSIRWNSVANSNAIDPLTRKSYSIAKPYSAAILEEFNKKLTIEKISNRTKLGQGMVSIYHINLSDEQFHVSSVSFLAWFPATRFCQQIGSDQYAASERC